MYGTHAPEDMEMRWDRIGSGISEVFVRYRRIVNLENFETWGLGER